MIQIVINGVPLLDTEGQPKEFTKKEHAEIYCHLEKIEGAKFEPTVQFELIV